MSVVTRRPRGRLPRRVYWVRRLLVIVVAVGLVLGIARLLDTGSSDPGAAARPVGAEPSSSTTTGPTTSAAPLVTAAPSSGRPKKGTKASRTPKTPTPLASPSGPCAAGDVVVSPAVKGTAYAVTPVTFVLTLTTKASPACRWTVGPNTLLVRVSDDDGRVWSTQDCRRVVPRQEVVVRHDHPTTVSVRWSSQRSDADCSRAPHWAEPGYYDVTAAAFGGDPVGTEFALVLAPRPTETVTASPSPSASGSAGGSPR